MKHHSQRGGPFKPPKKRRRKHAPIPDELRIGSLCTGYGGLDMAVRKVFGGVIAWIADNDRHVSKLLARRFPGVPNLGDLTTVNWHQVEPVDILCAGFPCQDISYAGLGAGIAHCVGDA